MTIATQKTLPPVDHGGWRRRGDLVWWEAALTGATVAFSTRLGGAGVSPYDTLNLGLHVGDDPAAVLQNRHAIWNALPFSGAGPVLGEQVHGTRVASIGRDDAGRGWSARETSLPDTDAMVTHDAATALGILVADCAPVAIVAPGRALGVAHAGWRGLAGGVIEATLVTMAVGAQFAAGDLHAVIGPCIRGCCYEVGEEVWRHFPPVSLSPTERPGARRLDLMTAVAQRLVQAGLPADHIHAVGLCTACHPTLFFSHRRATLEGMPTAGRTALFASRAAGQVIRARS